MSFCHRISERPSWWERIKAWIRHWLESADRNPPAWLRYVPHWKIGGALARLAVYGMVTVLLVTVAVIVFVELRAAGVLGKRTRRRSAARDVAGETRSKDLRGLGIEELDAVPAHERPVRLLRLLVEALMRSRRLDHDRDLTCRELIAQARFDDERQRNAFSHIALLAERVLYGPERAPAQIPDEMVSGARALHAQLLAAPSGAQPTAS